MSDERTDEQLVDYFVRASAFFGEQVRTIAATMGVVIEGTTKTGEGYEVAHSTQVVGFDKARAGRLVWTQGTSIGDFKNDFDRLAAAQA